jgi:D-3-phosphoglycerate dehydrogenase
VKVLVADPLSDAGVEALSSDFDVDVRTGLDKSQLLDIIGDYDAVVVRSQTTIDAELIDAASKLQVIARAGIGLDNVDVDAATTRGVLVCNAPQSNVISAAEHTVALLLSLARRIPGADATLRGGQWRRSEFQGTELHDKTLGVVGLGRVGVLVAQRLTAFGMRVAAYDPFVSSERAARMGVDLVPTVGQLCELADVITVHLPKIAETTGIVGHEELQRMKPSSLVVNTARGGIVDEDALHQALSEGWIAGAALDVFDEEPTTDSPLFKLSNTVVTPHLGASTAEAQDKAGTMVADAVKLALAGEVVPSAVNLQMGAGVPEPIKPYLPLAEALGWLLAELHSGQANELAAEYLGWIAEHDTQGLTLSALKGLLSGVVSEWVTYVNAPLLAEERGLKVSARTSSSAEDFLSLVRLSAGDAQVAGTVVGTTSRPRLVSVWDFGLDMELSQHMVFFRYLDRPGIVARIGQWMGDANVNIASMQLGRRTAGGDALIAMSVDSPVDDALVRAVGEDIGALDARGVNLPDRLFGE